MTDSPRTILFAAGGTGGHIYPALAVAREWLRRHPLDRAVFVGTDYGMEKEIVPRESFELRKLPARGVAGKSPLALAKGLWAMGRAMFEARTLLGELHPAAVLGTGGYASYAPMAAACRRGIPVVALEVNRRLGLANRLLRRRAAAFAVAFEETLPEAGPRAVWTGTPLRRFEEKAREHAKFGVFVFGGSQGSAELNRLMARAAPLLAAAKERFFLVHMRGTGKDEGLEAAYRAAGLDVKLRDYVDDMAWAYAQADVVVCRAGALTLAELALLGKPSILVPLASSTGGHQRGNALAFEKAGAGALFEGASSPGAATRMAETLSALASDATRLARMRDAARKLGRPGAAERVCDALEKILAPEASDA